MRCGWCDTNDVRGGERCVSCGGRLATAGALGAAPPAPPRELPATFVRRVTITHNGGVRFGAAFAAIGALGTLLFGAAALVVPLMATGSCVTVLFVVVGAGIGVAGWRSGQARLDVLRTGAAAPGQVTSVAPAANDGVSRPCWRLTYTFEADGQPRQGSVICADPEVTRFTPGHLVHVVYAPRDPGRSDVWPLLA